MIYSPNEGSPDSLQQPDQMDEVLPLNSSMEEKVMSYVRTLPNADSFECARDWYWHQINPLLAQASWEHIVMGDFNNRWPLSSPTGFQQECALQGLQNHLAAALTERGISTKTFYRDFKPWSDLDHILTTLPAEAQVGGGILNHASWWVYGPNHMPIWASYRLPKHETVQRTPWQVADRKLKLAIDRSNSAVVEDIQTASRAWLEQHPPPVYADPPSLAEREARLRSLQESLRDAVQATLMVKPKKVSPGRYFLGDFPPQLQLAKIHLHTLVHLRALVNLAPGSKAIAQ
jgi:hypothetical protein